MRRKVDLINLALIIYLMVFAIAVVIAFFTRFQTQYDLGLGLNAF